MYYKSLYNKKTKEYYLWKSIQDRIYPSKAQVVRYKSYIGTTMSDNFKDFQYFADWCNSQIGFEFAKTRPDTGPRWELDKDILFRDNKIYSETVCCFIPRDLNVLLRTNFEKRKEYPIGVTLSRRTIKLSYVAICSYKGINTFVGTRDTPYEAFLLYKSFKEKVIKEAANTWKDKIDPRVYQALMSYEVLITD